MREIKYMNFGKKYEIGNDGSVLSLDYNHTGTRKELHQYKDQDGYWYVVLNINGKRTKEMVHRLVAELFIPQIEGKTQVNHKNGVRTDNWVENLEWVTHQENVLHGWRSNGRKQSKKQIETRKMLSKGIKNPKAKITPEIAAEIVKFRKMGRPLKELAFVYHLSVSQISVIARGKYWK
ncbi:MAG TPA: HNH endonuclease signature motif containing protein [Clostridia bacterium]